TVDVNWGDGSPDSIFTRLTPGSLGTLSHTYTKGPLETYGPGGNYGVTVIVTNGHGDFGSAGFGVNLTNVPHLMEPLQPQSALKGQATTFHLGSFTDSNPADGPWAVDVNWGDNSPDSTFTRAAVGSLGDLAHTYATANQGYFGPPGTYTVGIRITNRHGDLG